MTNDERAARLQELEDRVAEAVGQISVLLNPARPAQTTASAQVHTGTSTASLVVGIVGVFAIVVALAAVLVVSAWRDADSRVFEAQSRMQAERNESIEDRLGVAEAQLRRLNRELEEAK